MNDLISVIVPVYNTEKYLKKCIESIINQTYHNLEIILINDGSLDESLKICEDYSKKDSRITVISQENKGVSFSRNKGIDNAKGKFLLFVDSDDYLENNMIEVLHNNIKDNDISICNYNKVFENKIIMGADDIGYLYLNNKQFMDDLLVANKYGGYLWNKLIRTDVIKDNRFNESLSIMEDLVFFCQVSKNVKKVVYDSTIFLYNYVIRENSAMNNKKVNESILEAFEILLQLLEQSTMLKSKITVDYVLEAMTIKYKLKKQNKLSKEKKASLNNVRNKYLMIGLKGKYYGINKKIKLICASCFTNLYFDIKNGLKK